MTQAVIEESMNNLHRNSYWYAFASPWRLITYVYPLLYLHIIIYEEEQADSKN
jgi:hypothetical protein